MRRRTRASVRHRRCLRLRGRREIDEICGGGGGTPRVRADTAASPKIVRNPTARNSSWTGGPVRTSAGFSSMRVTAKRVSSSTMRSISGCPPGRPSALARRLASRTSRTQRFRSSRVAGVAPTLSGTVPGDCALCATLPRRSTFLSAMCAPIQAATGLVLDVPHRRGGMLASIGDPTLADAILDRLMHNAYQPDLKGESMRRTRGPLNQTDHFTKSRPRARVRLFSPC